MMNVHPSSRAFDQLGWSPWTFNEISAKKNAENTDGEQQLEACRKKTSICWEADLTGKTKQHAFTLALSCIWLESGDVWHNGGLC